MQNVAVPAQEGFWTSLSLAVPECVLAVGAMALLLIGVFGDDGRTRWISWASIIVLAIAALFVIFPEPVRVLGFGGSFVFDPYGRFVKALIYIASAISIVMSQGFLRDEEIERFEYPVLVLLATLGMSMMVSANDLIALYMGIELQSLALYVLASFNRDSLRSTEAGLKYFVLGALSSGLLLYGCSLIYGFTGTTDFETLRVVLDAGELDVGVIFGLVFLCAGLAFKVSAVPFHMWTPDVYEGAPTPVVAFFSAAPKVAALALFVRVLIWPFAGDDAAMSPQWQDIIIALSALSMLVGAFAAIGQRNIKRLMAYSSISHMGYALVGLAAGSEEGVRGVLIYLTIYLPMTLGVFACILAMKRKEGMVEDIEALAGLRHNQPAMALALLVLMFSLAGIPPLAGFFAKFYVLVAAVNSGLYALAIIGVLASVIGAYYYVRIVKIMYFDEPEVPFVRPVPGGLNAVIIVSTVFTVFYVLFAFWLLDITNAVASFLFA